MGTMNDAAASTAERIQTTALALFARQLLGVANIDLRARDELRACANHEAR